MRFAASCIALGALVRIAETEAEEIRQSSLSFVVFCLGIFLVSATSLIAVPWAAAWFASAVVLLGFPNFLSSVRRNIVASLCFLGAMTGLGAYYWWTIRLGAHASGIATTNLSNLFLVIYEQLGLTGLGPGRTDLRVSGASGLRAYLFPLSLGILASAILFWQAVRSIPIRWWRSRQALGAFIGIIVPLVLVFGAGHAQHVRILGRHLMPLFPIVLFILALGFRRLQAQRSPARRLALAIIPLVFLVSALEIRFAPRHARDDYRGAAALARESAAGGGTVWWLADQSTGIYYGLPLDQATHASAQGTIMIPDVAQLAGQPEPEMIVLSKGDIYDPQNSAALFAQKHGFTLTHELQAFRIFEKPETTSH